MRQRVLTVLFVLGCGRTLPAPAPAAQASLLDAARARTVPARLLAKLSVQVRSEAMDVAGSSGGALILDRPGRGHVAVFSPLGGPLVTLQTDGTGLALALARERRHLVAAEADRVVREQTGGLVGIDEVLGLLVGDLPLDGLAPAGERRTADGDLEVVLEGPRGSRVVAVLDDPTAVPVSLVATDREGRIALRAAFAPFAAGADGVLLPTEVALAVPALDLDVELRYRSWTFPETVRDVFGLAPPEGFATGPLELVGTAAAEAVVRSLDGEGTPP